MPFNEQREPGIGEYGDTRQLSLKHGDIVIISGAPFRQLQGARIYDGLWGQPGTYGRVKVGRVIQPADYQDRYTQFAVEAGFTSDLKFGQFTIGQVDSIHIGFTGLSLLRRGVNSPQDGITVYRLRTLDGEMPLVVTETRSEGQSTFALSIDENPSLQAQERATERQLPPPR